MAALKALRAISGAAGPGPDGRRALDRMYISVRSGGWSLRLAGISISLTRPAKAVFVTLCVSALAIFWNPRTVQAWRRRSPFLFYTIAAVLMLLFALGPVGHVAKTTFLYQAPYYWLMQLPGGHAFRVPARFAMLFVLCLAESAALAFSHLTAGTPVRDGQPLPVDVPRTWFRARTLATVAVCLAVGSEGFVADMNVARTPAALDLAGLDRGAVVLELPIVDDYSDTAAMLRATQASHTLVNGFSGYVPPHYNLLKDGLAAFDDSILKALQQFGPLFVFVHQDVDPDQRYRDLVGDLPDAHRVLTTATGSLFQLPSRRASRVDSDAAQPIAAIHANAGELHVAEMIDGDLTTRWQTPFHQMGGNQVVVALDHPATLSRVELDLGEFKDDYPRRLRVSVEEPGRPSVTVWEGRTMGVAMIAALTDTRRMPLVFDLAPIARGRQVILTVLDGHPEFSWSIAELKVFGHQE